MKKRFLSLALCLCLTLTLLPVGAVAVECPGHGTALSGSMDICNLSANTNYYLSDDLTLSNEGNGIKVLSGTVNLCLNGHSIIDKMYGEKPVFSVPRGATLNIYDCQGVGTVQRNIAAMFLAHFICMAAN